MAEQCKPKELLPEEPRGPAPEPLPEEPRGPAPEPLPEEPLPEEPRGPAPEPQADPGLQDFGNCLMTNGVLYDKIDGFITGQIVNGEMLKFQSYMPEDPEPSLPEYIPGRHRPINGAPVGYIYKNKSSNGMPAGYYLETGATADRLVDNLVGIRERDVVDIKKAITVSIRMGVNPTVAFKSTVESYGYLIQAESFNNIHAAFIPSVTFDGPMTVHGYCWRSGKQGQGYYRYDMFGVLYQIAKLWSD